MQVEAAARFGFGGTENPEYSELFGASAEGHFVPAEFLSIRPGAVVVGDFETERTNVLRASGTVVLQLWIDASGRVVQVRLEESALPEPFVEAAQRAFIDAQFTPGELDGAKVATFMRVEVTYRDDLNAISPPGM